MDTALFMLGVVLAALGIGASIALHEIGHLVPAKRFGVRVTQYMVGFGPTVWSRHRGETEYGIKAIPLGGYIRMIGMYPPPNGAPEGTAGGGTTGRFAVLAEQARSQAWEEVAPGDDNRLFYRLSVPRKVVVMMGGPVMNLLIAFVLFGVLLIGLGLPTLSTRLSAVSPCLPAAMTSQQAAEQALADAGAASVACAADSTPSPATVAGLTAGDTIVAIDGASVSQWQQVIDLTRARPGGEVVLTVVGEDGDRRDVQLVVAAAYRPSYDADGLPTGQIERVGYVGIVPTSTYVRQPLTAVPATMWNLTARSVEALAQLPVRVAELARDLVTGQARDPRSPISVVGVGRLSGEIAAADQSVKAKAVTLLSLMAGLNLFLFLFNLIPLLPMDGGHVAGALFEGLRRRVARVRGRPDPGPVDVSRALPVAYAVALALVALSSIVILADIVKPITLNG